MRYTLFIDESGSISPNNGEKYFCIGGYLIENKNLDHKYKMMNIIKKAKKDPESYYNFFALRDKLTEIKFSNLNFEGKKKVLSELNKLSGKFVAIIVDKENCHTLCKNDTNEYYNYLVCQLVKYIFETCNHAGTLDFEELKIVYDDRSMKVKARNNLQAHLIEELKIKRRPHKQFSCNFNIKAADSKENYGVMVSDFVAGVCREKFKNRESKLKDLLHIEYLSKFPYKDFDKKVRKLVDKRQPDLYNVVNS